MADSLGSRIRKAWNAFTGRDPTEKGDLYGGYFYRPDRMRFTRGNERTIVTSIFNRIALDCAAINIRHVRKDEEGRYKETIDDGLNQCLNVEANLDQTGRAFIQDVVMSMFDEGCVAVVPVETSQNPNSTSSYDIFSMRTGKITQWYPKHVKVSAYNENTGKKEEIILDKRSVAIVENPMYSVINEPNSTMQRLIRKLSLLDSVDEQTSAGKLDIIIQLPYSIKTPLRQDQAEKRRKDLEEQLNGSRYGVAYTDATEHITQLNRPLENNLLSQIDKLIALLYSQLGLTEGIMNGSAKEEEMLNYYSRTIEPILSAISDEMIRKFLSKTARTQGQSIMFFREPFKLVPVSQIASIADSMTRNEIMTGNEVRQVLGLRPSTDPNADMLRNKNLNAPAGMDMPFAPEDPYAEEAPPEEGYEDPYSQDPYQEEYT